MSDEAIVYIVDDDDLLRKALDRLIGSVGLAVQTFATPAAFLAHPLPDRPACVLLDVRMPGTSGLTVQEELTQAGSVCPILFLTGHADVPTSVRAMKAGAVDFIEKPFNDQALLDAVHHALDHARELLALRRDRQLARRDAPAPVSDRRAVRTLHGPGPVRLAAVDPGGAPAGRRRCCPVGLEARCGTHKVQLPRRRTHCCTAAGWLGKSVSRARCPRWASTRRAPTITSLLT